MGSSTARAAHVSPTLFVAGALPHFMQLSGDGTPLLDMTQRSAVYNGWQPQVAAHAADLGGIDENTWMRLTEMGYHLPPPHSGAQAGAAYGHMGDHTRQPTVRPTDESERMRSDVSMVRRFAPALCNAASARRRRRARV